ncbi:MAG: DUF4870 domain-containing protein [Chromatiales bacterium]|nr:DUF4870 domain-containing protein [Chromatiales bacterium]
MSDDKMPEPRNDQLPQWLMLVLAYCGPLGLIPYFVMADDPFVRWHARQGLTLTGVWILLLLTLSFLAMMPLLGVLFMLLAPIVWLAAFAMVVVGIVFALRGERWRMPVIAELADKW